jgi:hypothetical protein
MYSVIATTERVKREKAAVTLGPLALAAPVLMLLCADLRRGERAAGIVSERPDDLTLLTIATLDLGFFAENIVIAAEALGLGSVYLGGASRKAGAVEALCEIFSIPQRVLPLLGLALGYPAERPLPRARLPLDNVLHWDVYHDMPDEELEAGLRAMTDGLAREGYYQGQGVAREQSYGYRDHFIMKYDRRWKSTGLKEALIKQGFDV